MKALSTKHVTFVPVAASMGFGSESVSNCRLICNLAAVCDHGAMVYSAKLPHDERCNGQSYLDASAVT